MSKKTGYLLGILLTIIICMILAWYFCCGASGTNIDAHLNDNHEVVTTPVPKPDKATSMGFTLNDPDGNVVYNYNDNFNFDTSQFSILEPVSGQVNEGIGKLQAYLNADGNSSKFVNIRGFYDTTEENTSALVNLGLARANAVKNYFVGKGIPSARINTFGELKDALTPNGTIYQGPIQYSMTAQANDNSSEAAMEMKAIVDQMNADPLVLNFNTAQTSIDLSAEQRRKVGDISRYLDKMPGSTVNIVGHTDNDGSRATNIRVGLERANFAKDYLVRNGISEARINTTSKGPDEPIANNVTPEGRAQNRRCVVTLNQTNN